jgi:hypothetical protein
VLPAPRLTRRTPAAPSDVTSGAPGPTIALIGSVTRSASARNVSRFSRPGTNRLSAPASANVADLATTSSNRPSSAPIPNR